MYNKLEKAIFIIYLILLPVTCFRPLDKYFMGITDSVSVFFHFIGLILIFINYKRKKHKMSSLLKYSLLMISILNISSIFMALILFSKLGTWLGRNTFIAIFPQVIYYTQIAFVLYYNYNSLNKFGIKLVKRIFEINIIYLLILGYIQILVINFNIPFLESIYKKVAEVFVNNSYVLTHNRVCLVATEASVAGVLLSIFIIPYIMAKILVRNNKYWVILALYIPIVYFTKSTSAYLGIFMVCGIVLYIFIKEYFNFKRLINFSLVIGIIVCISVLYLNNSRSNQNSEMFYNIKSIAINKLFDRNNYSTVHRTTSLYTGARAVIDYPILGVGNGNQGFFYIKHFPEWGYKSPESIDYYTGKSGWPGAGAFIPAYLSGYGIVGFILLIIFAVKSQRAIRKIKNYDMEWVFFYYIAIVGFLISAIISIDIVGNYYIIFILSLPLLNINTIKE